MASYTAILYAQNVANNNFIDPNNGTDWRGLWESNAAALAGDTGTYALNPDFAASALQQARDATINAVADYVDVSITQHPDRATIADIANQGAARGGYAPHGVFGWHIASDSAGYYWYQGVTHETKVTGTGSFFGDFVDAATHIQSEMPGLKVLEVAAGVAAFNSFVGDSLLHTTVESVGGESLTPFEFETTAPTQSIQLDAPFEFETVPPSQTLPPVQTTPSLPGSLPTPNGSQALSWLQKGAALLTPLFASTGSKPASASIAPVRTQSGNVAAPVGIVDNGAIPWLAVAAFAALALRRK